jgi:hypothetical protein
MAADLIRIIGLDRAIFGGLKTIPVIGGNSGNPPMQWPDPFTGGATQSLHIWNIIRLPCPICGTTIDGSFFQDNPKPLAVSLFF